MKLIYYNAMLIINCRGDLTTISDIGMIITDPHIYI